MKKFVVLLLLATLALSVGVGAAQDVTIPDQLPSGITIEYWHEWSNAQEDAINTIVDNFNSSNEWGITVNPTHIGGNADVQNEVNTAVTSGDLPNISGAIFPDIAQGLYLADVLIPLDTYMNDPKWGFSEEEMANLNLDIINVNRVAGEPFNDQLLAWPIGSSANVLSVNTTMLAQLGMDHPPQTLQEFHDAACGAAALTGPNGEDIQGFPLRVDAFDMFSFIISNGGYVFDADTQQYNFTNPGAIEVLQLFQDLYNEGCAYIAEGFSNTGDFALGLNPMAVGSSAGIPFIASDISKNSTDMEWVNTTTPWKEGNQTLQLFLRSMSVLVSTPEKQLASWLFLKYLSTPEAQNIWTQKTQYFPYTRTGLAAISDGTLTDLPAQFTQVGDLMTSPDVKLWAAPQALGSQQVFFGVADTLVANITTGGQDVMEAATAAETAANQALSDAQESM